jgi:hypothetical protein
LLTVIDRSSVICIQRIVGETSPLHVRREKALDDCG